MEMIYRDLSSPRVTRPLRYAVALRRLDRARAQSANEVPLRAAIGALVEYRTPFTLRLVTVGSLGEQPARSFG